MRGRANLFIAVALGGASAAPAAPESRNPFHCSIAIEASYELAKAKLGIEDALTRELHTRFVWQAFAAAAFPKRLDSELEADGLRQQFGQDSQSAVALAEACMKRQDAHPKFRAARLEKQVRDGLPKEPVSARASIEGLKALHAPALPIDLRSR